MSRWRGVGPDCFRRYNRSWPEGPENPAYRKWQNDAELARAAFEPEVALARAEHDRRAAEIRAVHASDVRRWEAQGEARAQTQRNYDRATGIWRKRCAALEAERAAWRRHPARRAASRARVQGTIAASCSAFGLVCGWFGLGA